MSGAISIKSVLWVYHRNRRIRNRTSDEEVIKKRRFKIKKENEKEKQMKMMITDEMKKKGRRCMFILK